MNLSDALDAFLQAAQADNLAKTTIKWYTALLVPMVDALDVHNIGDATTVMLREYIVSLRSRTTRYGDQRPEQQGGLSPESVASHIRAMHRFWKWCSLEFDIKNPMERIRHPGKGKVTPKGISPDDLRNMLFTALENENEVLAARDAAIVSFLGDTGCRAGGLLSLGVKDVDLERHTAIVLEKGDKLRRVKFLPITTLAISRWFAFRPPSQESALFLAFSNGTVIGALKYSGLYQALKRVAHRAGVEGRFNPHSFRHGFARDYLLNGGDLATLAQILGRSSSEVTAHFYAVFEQNHLAELHDRYSPMRVFDVE